MTLNTKVAIAGPVDAMKVYRFGRDLLDTPDDIEPERGESYLSASVKWIANPIGIGLSAILTVKYSNDDGIRHVCDKFCDAEVGPSLWNPEHVVTQEEVEKHRRCIDSDPSENGWAQVVLSFDTAYGYRGDNGERCSELHVRLMSKLGKWLDDQGLEWKWCNEYTDEWHDRYDGMVAFVGGGDQAMRWFDQVVAPYISGQAQ
ncbi:hypothetical protein [Sciscionella sediminilitoris]|uniref:hypothetical protein n=1 Tax=Sciscionella sediminilitoris TaxID=1445613 RepID=UPI0004DF6BAB|nr:hypothetical protein [Sciscionella sp. SE31]